VGISSWISPTGDIWVNDPTHVPWFFSNRSHCEANGLTPKLRTSILPWVGNTACQQQHFPDGAIYPLHTERTHPQRFESETAGRTSYGYLTKPETVPIRQRLNH
jgi:hypothetical protein